MTERPIIFKPHEVRAALNGGSQFRRVVTHANSTVDGHRWNNAQWATLDWLDPIFNGTHINVPHIDGETRHRVRPLWQRGDRLWVRETFINGCDTNDCGDLNQYDEDGNKLPEKLWYAATCPKYFCWLDDDGRMSERIPWRPSIHMPRWASRLLLEVTDARVGRTDGVWEWVYDYKRVEEPANAD